MVWKHLPLFVIYLTWYIVGIIYTLIFILVNSYCIFDTGGKLCAHCLPLFSLFIRDDSIPTGYMLVHPGQKPEVLFLTLSKVCLLGFYVGQPCPKAMDMSSINCCRLASATPNGWVGWTIDPPYSWFFPLCQVPYILMLLLQIGKWIILECQVIAVGSVSHSCHLIVVSMKCSKHRVSLSVDNKSIT